MFSTTQISEYPSRQLSSVSLRSAYTSDRPQASPLAVVLIGHTKKIKAVVLDLLVLLVAGGMFDRTRSTRVYNVGRQEWGGHWPFSRPFPKHLLFTALIIGSRRPAVNCLCLDLVFVVYLRWNGFSICMLGFCGLSSGCCRLVLFLCNWDLFGLIFCFFQIQSKRFFVLFLSNSFRFNDWNSFFCYLKKRLNWGLFELNVCLCFKANVKFRV